MEDRKVAAVIEGIKVDLDLSDDANLEINRLNQLLAKKVDRLTLFSAVVSLLEELIQVPEQSYSAFIVQETFGIGIFLDVKISQQGVSTIIKNIVSNDYVWCLSGIKKANIKVLMAD